MEANSAKLKFKSSVNLYFAIAFALFQIIIVLLLSSIIYTTSKTGFKFGLFLGMIDVIAVIPMFSRLRYEIHDEYLYVCDWPFGAYKIPYKDILSIDEPIPEEQKHVRKVGLSTKQMPLSYVKYKKGERQTAYMMISPADKDAFLTFLNTKIKMYKKMHPEEALLQEQESIKPPTENTFTKKITTEETSKDTPKKVKTNIKPKPVLKKAETVSTTSTTIKKDIPSKKELVKAKKEKIQEEILEPKTQAQTYFTVEDDEKKPK